MKDKSAKSLADAVTSIFTTLKRMPNKIHGDKSNEFVNRTFKSFLKDHKIHYFSTEKYNIKVSVVERFNRTFKSKMWRYFTYTRKNRYVDTLDNLVLSYNNSKHRTIRMSSTDVTTDDEGSKRHSLQVVELSQRTQAAVQIVSNLPAPSNGGPIYRFLGQPAMRTRWMAGAVAHKSG